MAMIHLHDPNRKVSAKKNFRPKSRLYRNLLIGSVVINAILAAILIFNK